MSLSLSLTTYAGIDCSIQLRQKNGIWKESKVITVGPHGIRNTLEAGEPIDETEGQKLAVHINFANSTERVSVRVLKLGQSMSYLFPEKIYAEAWATAGDGFQVLAPEVHVLVTCKNNIFKQF